MAEMSAARTKTKRKPKRTDHEGVAVIESTSDLQLPEVPTHALTEPREEPSIVHEASGGEVCQELERKPLTHASVDSARKAEGEKEKDNEEEKYDRTQFEIGRENVVLLEDEGEEKPAPHTDPLESFQSAKETLSEDDDVVEEGIEDSTVVEHVPEESVAEVVKVIIEESVTELVEHITDESVTEEQVEDSAVADHITEEKEDEKENEMEEKGSEEKMSEENMPEKTAEVNKPQEQGITGDDEAEEEEIEITTDQQYSEETDEVEMHAASSATSTIIRNLDTEQETESDNNKNLEGTISNNDTQEEMVDDTVKLENKEEEEPADESASIDQTSQAEQDQATGVVKSPSEEDILLDKKPSKTFCRFSDAESVRLRSSTIGSITSEHSEDAALGLPERLAKDVKFSPENSVNVSVEPHSREGEGEGLSVDLVAREEDLTVPVIDVINNNDVVEEEPERESGSQSRDDFATAPPLEPDHAPNASQSQPDVCLQERDHLYPSLPGTAVALDPNAPEAEEGDLEPFTEAQLRTLYYNQQLEDNESFVDNFLDDLQVQQQEFRHEEFHELVQNYHRARHRMSSAEHDVNVLKRDTATYSDIVWEIRQETVQLQGQCVDKAKVYGEHGYHKAVYNEEACKDLQRSLKDIRNQIHEELALYAYEAQLSKLQVESFIHRLYAEHPALPTCSSSSASVSSSPPVRQWLPPQRDARTSHQVAALRRCVAVLFAFQRRPATDDVFVVDTRRWLTNMVSSLLRLATLDDHLYLLNQVIRCPGGVGKWATSFIQTLPPTAVMDQPAWDSPFLDHLINMIATLLVPVRAREEVLYQMKVSLTPTPDKTLDNPWILVDSDGEEDEDPLNSWYYLQENDIVRLLNQLPIEYAFKHVLFVTQHDGQDVYSVHRTSEGGMLRLFAFATCVVRLLGQGLQHYQLGRYRQLNKRLGRLLRQVVHYCSDHWQTFQETLGATLPPHTMKRLQLEYDHMFYRATQCLLSAHRLGSWQYLANLPFQCVSLDMMWRLMWLMHRGCQGNMPPDDIENSTPPAATECFVSLQDTSNQAWFEERLISMPINECIYLLTTFANMARSRPHTETNFMEAVAIEIFNIAYIGSHSREFCARPGRELLFSIACQHPSAMSLLLHKCRATINSIGKVSQLLFDGLPLQLWVPTADDIALLREWLLDNPIAAPESQLARLVIHAANWEMDEKSHHLHLPVSMHQEMALLLVEVHAKHLAGKLVTGIFTDAISSADPSSLSTDQQLTTWLWSVALRLKLHTLSLPHTATSEPPSDPSHRPGHDLPDLHRQDQWTPIMMAQGKGYSLATYLSLVMSRYGHNIEDFCVEGVNWLQLLLEKGHYVAVVRAISYITPLSVSTDHLLLNTTFVSIVQQLLGVDYTRRSMVFSAQFPGPVTSLIANAIEHQIYCAVQESLQSGQLVVMFWIKLLTKLNNWHGDRSILYVLDSILMAAFQIKNTMEEKLYDFFYKITKDFARHGPQQSLLGSVVQWLSSSSTRPSLIDASSSPEFPWFAWVVLHCEARWEAKEAKIWPTMQKDILSEPGLTVDLALRKSVSGLPASPPPPAPYRLCIYRWAQQALDMGFSEPLLPLVWQRFFALYLGRLTPEAGLPSRGSVGERFFDASPNISMLKRMKKRLQDTADHFNKLASRLSPTDEEEEDAAPPACPEEVERKKALYTRLAKCYQTFLYWLDEPRLHDPSLYLPALPPQYQPDLLQTLFNNPQSPWLDLFDAKSTDGMLLDMVGAWEKHCTHSRTCNNPKLETPDSKLTPVERILDRVHVHERMEPPPPLPKLSCPVPEVPASIVTDKQNLLFSLRADFNSLVDYAKVYSSREAKNVHLDCSYIELLPQLYTNDTTEASVSIQCRSSFNPTHRCKGAAVITCRFQAAKRNDIIHRKVSENRAEYKQMMIESLLPPPANVCSGAVHVENAVTSLIKLKNSTNSACTRQTAVNVGITLFYHVATFISENTKYYPPTRQFFSSLIEILGQEFIRNNPSQSQPLLQAILQTPILASLLSPNFSPNASPDLFTAMYEDMIPVPNNQGPEVAFTLLTKFDVAGWLSTSRPPLSARSALVASIGSALDLCGAEAGDEHGGGGEMRLVFEVYRSHLIHLFLYNFPDHYGDVLRMVLKGSGSGSLSVLVWEDLLTCLGCGPKPSKRPAPQMSLNHVKETMEWLSSHFFRLRVLSTDTATFGLYPKWKLYVPSITSFLHYLSTQAIKATISRVKESVVSANEGLDAVWTVILDLFAPWIQPLDNNGQILSSWTPGDAELAGGMVDVWIQTVATMQDTFQDYLSSPELYPINRLLPYYVSVIAKKGTPEHVLAMFHTYMAKLEWKQLLPGEDTMELFIKVVHNGGYPPCCKQFIGELFTGVAWSNVVTSWTQTLAETTAATCHGDLFHALLCLAKEPEVLEREEFANLLRSATKFDWNAVNAVSFNTAVEAFVNNCDPRCVLAQRSSHPAAVLSLMRSASGIASPSPPSSPHSPTKHPETPVKRATYIRNVIHLLCRCTHLDDLPDPDSFQPAVANTFCEVETCVSSIVLAVDQRSEALALCKELLNLLNNCRPSMSGGLEEHVLGWVHSSPSSALLYPLIAAAATSLASLPAMLRLIEACMETHFLAEREWARCDDGLCGWGGLLEVLSIPALSPQAFLHEAVTAQAYLTLHAYTLHTLPLSQSLEDERRMLDFIVQWTGEVKPGANSAPKLLLWWSKFLELSVRQLDFGGHLGHVAKAIGQVSTAMAGLGEDKTTTGILGAIGLGKKSQLDIRFRLIAKALAVYLAAQVPNDNYIRLHAGAAGHISHKHSQSPTGGGASSSSIHPSQHAVHHLRELEGVKTNKQYAGVKEHGEYALEFLMDPSHGLREALVLFAELVARLYPDSNYLAVVRPRKPELLM